MYNLELENRCLERYSVIGGLDEAGRGPLAGPVVAACVAIERGTVIKDKCLQSVRDSKKISYKKREELYNVIISTFNNVGIGVCDNQAIDQFNVLQATYLAMKKAIGGLKMKPSYLIIDGVNILPNISIKQSSLIKGDSKMFVIAAASIIAKVTRDRLMLNYHDKYPEYGFDQHKGYGTKLHLLNLKKHGPCAIHRRSFAPVKGLL